MPFARGGITRTHRRANFGQLQSLICRMPQNLGQRLLQIFLDIIAEGFEGRDIDDLDAVGEGARETMRYQAIDRPQKGGEGFARAGGCRD